MRYNKEQLKGYLLINYPNVSKEIIINDLGLSWNYIQKKAHIFNIKRDLYESKNNSKYSKLVEYDNISCYWLGFILADGHITKDKRIQINLSKKDRLHILKIIDHLGDVKVYENEIRISIVLSDKITIDKIITDFNWKSNKTKIPPIIPDWLTNDQLFSLIIGFIDGDGYINKKGRLIVKCHESWCNILEYFYRHLTSEYKKATIYENCSIIFISKYNILNSIKEKCIMLNLPIMNRKWDRIVNKIVKQDKKNLVFDLLKKGLSIREIESKGFSRSLIYKCRNELKN
jgi:hypothetical protein